MNPYPTDITPRTAEATIGTLPRGRRPLCVYVHTVHGSVQQTGAVLADILYICPTLSCLFSIGFDDSRFDVVIRGVEFVRVAWSCWTPAEFLFPRAHHTQSSSMCYPAPGSMMNAAFPSYVMLSTYFYT